MDSLKLGEASSSGQAESRDQGLDNRQQLERHKAKTPQQFEDGTVFGGEDVESDRGSVNNASKDESTGPAEVEEETSKVDIGFASKNARTGSTERDGDSGTANVSEQPQLQSVGHELAELHYNMKSDRLNDQIASVQSMGGRLNLLEDRLEELLELLGERKRNSGPQQAARRETATPELNFLPWDHFIDGHHRGRDVTDDEEKLRKPHFAIDVLVGEPVTWWQKEKSKKQTASSGPSKSQATPIGGLQRRGTFEPGNMHGRPGFSKPLPERIRINSRPLLSLIAEIGKVDENLEYPLVIRKPYKMLIYCETELKRRRDDLQEKWAWPADGNKNEASGNESSGASSSFGQVPSTQDQNLPTGEAQNAVAKGNVNTNLRDSAEALHDLNCLINFMDEYLTPRVQRYQNLNHPKIRFDELWYLFSPGDDVISGQDPSKALRVLTTCGGRYNLATSEFLDSDTNAPKKNVANNFQVRAVYLDFDGKRFGAVDQEFQIEPFENEKDVTSLKIFPLRYLLDAQKLRRDLTTRGRSFVECTKPQVRHFKGRMLSSDWSGNPLEDTRRSATHNEDVDAQIIIDADRALRSNHGWTPKFADMSARNTFKSDARETLQKLEHHCKEFDWCGASIDEDAYFDTKRMEDLVEEHPILGSSDNHTVTEGLHEEYLPIVSGFVFGFILRTRKWGCFPLSELLVVHRSKKGFEDLQLRNKEHKRIIEALVRTHLGNRFQESEREADLVAGKGQGLVILLHGAPGVGKTSTAECIAEYTGKPLLPITCGDLGVEAEAVQSTLDRNFELAQAWDCILLLDEADVFIAQRANTDLNRNALVSIFLRSLEYYTGILFITTNRVGSIDEAFKSRIHLSLHYPALDLKQAILIWKLNLKRTLESRAKTLQADEKQKERLENWVWDNICDKNQTVIWNGRQIRNAFSTAAALAEFETADLANGAKASLETKFFDVVMDATKAFDRYLIDTRSGRNDEERMAQLHLRMKETFNAIRHISRGYQNQDPAQAYLTPQSASPHQSSFGQQPQARYGFNQQTMDQRMNPNGQIAGQQLTAHQQQHGLSGQNLYQGFQSSGMAGISSQPTFDGLAAVSPAQAGFGLPRESASINPSFSQSSFEEYQAMQRQNLMALKNAGE